MLKYSKFLPEMNTKKLKNIKVFNILKIEYFFNANER